MVEDVQSYGKEYKMLLEKKEGCWRLVKMETNQWVFTVQVKKDKESFVHIRLTEQDKENYMNLGSAYLNKFALEVENNPLAYFDRRHEFQ
jgi:hypothetical protein